MLSVSLLASLFLQKTLEAPPANFKFLPRHQNKDGSWGARPKRCACEDPCETLREAPDPEKIAALVRQLGDDNPEARDSVEYALRKLGEPALAALRRGSESADAEVRARCERLRGAIPSNFKGVSDVETTSLVLLTYLGAGYTHLSRDSYGAGDAVKRGLQWLVAQQDTDGTFNDKDSAANAVAALALTETYGMTASPSCKEPAQRAVAAVERMDSNEPSDLAWNSLVLVSARMS